MKVLKAILNTIINILIVIVLIVSIVIAVLAISSKASGGVATIFGYTIQTIQSDSMAGGSPEGYEGGDIKKGDVVIGKRVENDDTIDYKVGDIITYMGYLEGSENDDKQMICHRIVDAVKQDGELTKYQTQGDNRSIAFAPDQETVDEYITCFDIVAMDYTSDYHCTVIPGIGGFLDFIRTQLGFFLVVLLPMIAFFLYELIRVVLNATKYKKEKFQEEKEEAVKAAEYDKQAAIDAAVAEALRKREEQDHTVSAPVEIPENSDHSSDFPQMTADEYEEFKKFQEFKKMQENDNSQ